MTIYSGQIAQHFGFVTRDAAALAETYERLLGARFQIADRHLWDMNGEPVVLRMAHGAMAGALLEIIEVREGTMPHSQFLEEHGEGLQHMGVWVPDVQAATRRAVELGATIQWIGAMGALGPRTVAPGASVEAILAEISPEDGIAYVQLQGPGNAVSIEYVGPTQQAKIVGPSSQYHPAARDLVNIRPPNWFPA